MRIGTPQLHGPAGLMILAVMTLGLTGCGANDEPRGEVSITTGSDTSSETSTLPAEQGQQATFRCLGEDIVMTIKDVDDDRVVLGTSTEMARRGDGGGINLNDPQDEFEVGADPVGFATPTMDAGCAYFVSWKRD